VYDTPTDPIGGNYVQKLLIFPDKKSMDFKINSNFTPATMSVGRNTTANDEELIRENGGDILTFVKTIDKRIQFIRDNNGIFEYSTDGVTWLHADSAWFPVLS
jgi:hypothetical protein